LSPLHQHRLRSRQVQIWKARSRLCSVVLANRFPAFTRQHSISTSLEVHFVSSQQSVCIGSYASMRKRLSLTASEQSGDLWLSAFEWLRPLHTISSQNYDTGLVWKTLKFSACRTLIIQSTKYAKSEVDECVEHDSTCILQNFPAKPTQPASLM